jgi:TonB-linked SusC/RagA family outer membrane protein
MRNNFTRPRGRSKGFLPESIAGAVIFLMRVSSLCILFIVAGLHLLRAEAGYGQTTENSFVEIHAKHVSLREIISVIEHKTDFMFVFPVDMIDKFQDVAVSEGKQSVKIILECALSGSSLEYRESGKNIIIFESVQEADERPEIALSVSVIPIKGRVTDDLGNPMPGVNVIVKGTTYGTSTDANGDFHLEVPENATIFIFSFIGFKTLETPIDGRTQFDIVMQPDATTLEAVQVSGGYYETTARMKTGSIVKVSAKDIENQPVTSPLLALQGRMPGVEITPTSGAPGSAVRIQIRGQNSMRVGNAGEGSNGNLPLYVIDGIPVNSSPIASRSISLLRDGIDPLSTLNPSNIESIQVLKDADATAIYGSRGANGVVLITTKNKKQAEGLHADVSVYRGFGEIVNRVEMLSTSQYLAMRHEAIQNDGGNAKIRYDNPVMGPYYYPDLLHWDTTRYTDWQEKIVGHRSNINDIQFNIAGGTGRTSIGFGGAYHKETLIYPGNFGYSRYSGNLNLNHASIDGRFNLSITCNYGLDENKLFDSDQLFGVALTLAPDAPEPYNDDGTLNWSPIFGVNTWLNPLSFLRTSHVASAHNLITNVAVSYDLTRGFSLTMNAGFSRYDQNETITKPITSLNPYGYDPLEGNSRITNNQRTSWILEPQLTYRRSLGAHTLTGLAGLSIQQANNISQSSYGTGYTADALLGTLGGAARVVSTGSNTQYRYGAVFMRVGYDYKGKYLVNVTARRDGSSRFGPGHRYGNFGAVGAAWIFSEESFLRDASNIFSFGKMRGSYGITGNDQIGDSKYIKTYQTSYGTYHGSIGLVPTALYNPEYAWEETKKLEAAVELGFFNDRIFIEIASFRNRSSNQLINYQLPATAGFSDVLTNFNATVENKGMEYSLTTRNIDRERFRWTTTFNISALKNELVAFPGIEESSYSSTFKVGEPLSIRQGYLWTGIDPATGIHTFKDLNDSGDINTFDQDFLRPMTTRFFGGITNTVSFAGFELNFLLQFSDRYASVEYFPTPGTLSNQPRSVLNRWQKEGDITDVQRFTTSGPALRAYSNYRQSDGVIERVSFLRLKTLTLSYSLPLFIIERAEILNAKIFVQGQNVFTSTDFDGWDPETLYGAPPLRIISGGIQLKF